MRCRIYPCVSLECCPKKEGVAGGRTSEAKGRRKKLQLAFGGFWDGCLKDCVLCWVRRSASYPQRRDEEYAADDVDEDVGKYRTNSISNARHTQPPPPASSPQQAHTRIYTYKYTHIGGQVGQAADPTTNPIPYLILTLTVCLSLFFLLVFHWRVATSLLTFQLCAIARSHAFLLYACARACEFAGVLSLYLVCIMCARIAVSVCECEC